MKHDDQPQFITYSLKNQFYSIVQTITNFYQLLPCQIMEIYSLQSFPNEKYLEFQDSHDNSQEGICQPPNITQYQTSDFTEPNCKKQTLRSSIFLIIELLSKRVCVSHAKNSKMLATKNHTTFRSIKSHRIITEISFQL